jgi:predicted ATPase/class 3 adenylate cyclase
VNASDSLVPTGSSTALPTGTVTFLFTDIEGSTRLLQQLGDRWEGLLADERRLLREAWATHDGIEFGTEGDAHFVVFRSAVAAVRAALLAQRSVIAHAWPDGAAVRIRMGIHTGEGVVAADDYVGLDLHRAARISNAGHGCQVLLSDTARALVSATLPDDLSLRDLGEYRLKDLSRPEHLYQLVAPDLPADFPALRTLDASPNNLPTQLTSFIGRTEQLNETRELLDRARVLTLVGPGGTGKTRLALALAAAVLDRFPDGVYWVPLASITDPALVGPSIGQALALHESSPRPVIDRLVEALGNRRVLLVLDNFEQILDAAPIVGEILRGTGETRIVVTSRAPLRISGEQEYPVPPLPVPDAAARGSSELVSQFEAVRLFIERAMAVRPDFHLGPGDAAAVAEISARLDGLPLAIELAAARIKLLTPQQMLPRLEQRLDLLAGGARDLPDRQRTLRGAIDWSYDLLDEAHRRLFGRFSVFVGGATLEAAEAVCGPAPELGLDVLEGIGDLVDHSLIRQVGEGEEIRFAMLETIREYGLAALVASGDRDEIRRRHAAHQVDLVGGLAPDLLGADQARLLDRLEREHDNIRAALTWADETGDASTALPLATGMWRFWQIRGHLHEGRDRLRRALALPGGGIDRRVRAVALEALGGIEYWLAEFDAASRTYEDAKAIYESIGDQRGVAEQHYNLSLTQAWRRDSIPIAREHAEKSLELFRALGDRPGIMRATWGLADVELWEGDLEPARLHSEEAVAMAEELGDRFMFAWAVFMRAATKFQQRDLAAAKADLSTALDEFLSTGDVTGHALVLDATSWLAWEVGQRGLAMRLAGFTDVLQARTGSRLAQMNRDQLSQFKPQDQLADPGLAREWDAGRTMSLDEAVATARTDEEAHKKTPSPGSY